MMKKIYNLLVFSLLGATFFACDSEDDLVADWIETAAEETETPVTGDAGSLDLSNYVSVGNSITAGFYDGALFPVGQATSYPSILAGQFAIAGGGEFAYPNIISGATGTGRVTLDLGAALAALAGQGSLADALVTGEANSLTANTVSSLNNFGVPGARSIDIVTAGYGAANPFFGAFQSDATASIVGDAAAAGGSFFSLWIGSNDVLGYTLGGGVNDTFNPLDPSTITDVASFSGAISGALDALSAGGADGVILTIPPVTTIPYMQAATDLGGGAEALLPAGAIDEATAAVLNGAEGYGAYNDGLAAAVALGIITQAEADRRNISFSGTEANAPVITDESLTTADISAAFGFPAGSVVLGNWRQASDLNTMGLGDLFPLDALFVLGVTMEDSSVPGVSVPLDDNYTLTESEQVSVITAVATFNAIIRGQAEARANITLVDLDPLFADANGLTVEQATGLAMSPDGIAAADGTFGISNNGVNYVPISFATEELYNSLFSTDFVHPNARGAAFITNEIIDVLNATYGSTIPMVNPADYAPINAPL